MIDNRSQAKAAANWIDSLVHKSGLISRKWILEKPHAAAFSDDVFSCNEEKIEDIRTAHGSTMTITWTIDEKMNQ